MATENPQLAVDEKLFLLATRVLADLEDEGESFALVNAVSRFSQAPYLAIRFQNAIGRELGAEERRAIDYYVAAVYLVYHHRANIESLDEVFADLIEPVADFIRTAAWAFLTAWNLR